MRGNVLAAQVTPTTCTEERRWEGVCVCVGRGGGGRGKGGRTEEDGRSIRGEER